MNKRNLLVAAVLIAAAAAAIYTFTRRPHATKDTIRISGNIEATTVEVSFKIPGRVKELLVDEGQMVESGRVVARLENDDQTHEVAARLAEMQTAQAALAELQAGSRKEEIAQAEAALERAKAEEQRVRVDYARQQELHKKEVISTRDLDAARTRYDTARASVREAAERLALVRKGPRRETIEQAQARLRTADAALASAKSRLGYTTLHAPITGMILSKNVESGEQVSAGTPVITVGDLRTPWVRAYINETDLGKVKVGQPVKVTTDTWPDRTYEGRITFIASEAEFTPKYVQTAKERVKLVYRIKITIPNPNMELKPGMPADGEIFIGTGDQGPGTGRTGTGDQGPGTGK